MRAGKQRPLLWQKQRQGLPQPWTIGICALLLGLCSSRVDIAGVFASTTIGALFTLRAPLQTRIVFAALTIGLAAQFKLGISLASAIVWAQAAVSAFAPRRLVDAVMRLPRRTWHVMIVFAAASICGMLLEMGNIPTAIALTTSGYLGVNVARHVAMTDARLLNWGDDSLVSVTRDLLLGRVTSGMLHDLAQPLNVISMANGNLEYIVSQLGIDSEDKRQLLDRIERISKHNQDAASILNVFRWFGREGANGATEPTIRSALERAVVATRSNVRHNDVAVDVRGDALDILIPDRHGNLEIVAVAALLCAFSSFTKADGSKKRGEVALIATTSNNRAMIAIHCVDEFGLPLQGPSMDLATSWLVEQVAKEASGDFYAYNSPADAKRFLIRLHLRKEAVRTA